MNRQNHRAAFPEADNVGINGITKREWYAGLALAAIVGEAESEQTRERLTPTQVASRAVLYADELIAALDGRP